MGNMPILAEAVILYLMMQIRVSFLCHSSETAAGGHLGIESDAAQTLGQSNTDRSPNVVLILGQRRRRCTNIKITLGKRSVFAGG